MKRPLLPYEEQQLKVKVTVYDEAQIKLLQRTLFITFMIIHLLTADYKSWGYWAVQPFNVKNLFFFSIMLPIYFKVVKEGKKGNVTDDTWGNANLLGIDGIFVLFLTIFCWYAIDQIVLAIFDISILNLPTIWVGFKP